MNTGGNGRPAAGTAGDGHGEPADATGAAGAGGGEPSGAGTTGGEPSTTGTAAGGARTGPLGRLTAWLPGGARARAGGGTIARVSVERPLWRALIAFRVLSLVYAIARYAHVQGEYVHPSAAWTYLGLLTLWTFGTTARVSSARRCTRPFLAADFAISLAGVLLTTVLDSHAAVTAGQNTLPGIWTAGSVLAFAIKGGWRWAAPASVLLGVSNVVERGRLTQGNLHSSVLLFFIGTGIGYVVEVARSSERALTRALQIEAATHERERLARDIHDSVLQVLAMVQRRGGEIGGEAGELGRLAGEQEAALRELMLGAPLPPPREGRLVLDGGRLRLLDAPGAGEAPAGPADLRTLLGRHAVAGRVTLSAPGAPVPLEPHAAAEVAAAVAAALDNVARHAGPGARAWILVEDEGDAVLVTVRDDGPGIPGGRLAAAESEGRLGVAQSIRGRLRDLGGTAELLSVPGQGVEVELRVPRPRTAGRGAG